MAFEQDSDLSTIETIWVAQTGGKVVLKGEVPSQDTLDSLVAIAEAVNGATEVESDQVTITG